MSELISKIKYNRFAVVLYFEVSTNLFALKHQKKKKTNTNNI